MAALYHALQLTHTETDCITALVGFDADIMKT